MANLVDNRCELDAKYETPLIPFLPVDFGHFEADLNKTLTTPGPTETRLTTTPLAEISTNAVSINEQDQPDKFLQDRDFSLTEEQSDVVVAAPVVKKVNLAINLNCSQNNR